MIVEMTPIETTSEALKQTAIQWALRAIRYEVADQQWLDNVMRYLESQRPR
ncbi:hypothetical protein Q2941_39905 [Bradyrhizobium sp. UFLA05-153]